MPGYVTPPIMSRGYLLGGITNTDIFIYFKIESIFIHAIVTITIFDTGVLIIYELFFIL